VQQGKYPRPENKLDMTAHTFMVFAVHSVSLLADLVPTDHHDSVYWRSWLLHHQILCMVLATEFTLEEVRSHNYYLYRHHPHPPAYAQVKLLDVTIYSHHTLFLTIPEYYDMWVPKFHFVQHIPIHILLFGPPRLYMAFMLETKNGIYSRAGEHCNFKNPLLSMATRVELRRAYELYAGLTKSHLTIFDVASTEFVSPGQYPYVDLVLHLEREAQITWLNNIIHNRKRITYNSWALVGTSEGRTLAQVEAIFQFEEVTYVALHMYSNLKLQAAAGCGQCCVFAASTCALHSATKLLRVHPFNELRMTLLHSRLHMESQAIRFIPIF